MHPRLYPAVLMVLVACVPPTIPPQRPQQPFIITADSWTRPYRWSKRQSRQLSVYVGAVAGVNRVKCDSLVDRALAAWSENGRVDIMRTTNMHAADVRITWTRSLPAQHPGVTLLRPNGLGELIAADVFVSVEVPSRGDVSSERVLYGIVAHEIGHALGLPHTRMRNRIMNEVLHTLDITPADIATLRELRAAGS